MVRYCWLLLFLFGMQLWAQTAVIDEDIQEVELIELSLDEIQAQTWQQDAENLSRYTKHWALENRFWLDEQLLNLHRFSAYYGGHKLDFALLKNWEEPSTHIGVTLKINSDGAIKEMILGNYRPRFGTGISLGATGGRKQSKILELGTLGSVDVYSPMGAAFKAKLYMIEAMAFASMQNRALQINQYNQITGFKKHKSSLESSDKEGLWGSALAFENKHVAFGALLYEQINHWEAQNQLFKQSSLTTALALKLNIQDFDFDLELGQLNQNTHAFATLRYEHAGFKQSFSFAKDPDRKRLAYSNFAQALTSSAEAVELSYNALFPIVKRLKLQLLFSGAQNQKHQQSSNAIKSRMVAKLIYSDAASTLGFKLSRFDREVLAHTLQDYSISRPDHWRFELDMNHKVLPHLQLQLHCRYHIEDKISYQNNGFFYHSGLSYSHQLISLEAGYKACFKNQYGFYYLDQSYEGWSFASKDDSELYLAGKWELSPVSVSLHYKHSLQESKNKRLLLAFTIKS